MEFFIGPLMGRSLDLLATNGGKISLHRHKEPHVTLCLSGSMLVTSNGKQTVLDSRAAVNERCMNVPAGEEHEITSLEDGTQFVCLFVRQPGHDRLSDPAYSD